MLVHIVSTFLAQTSALEAIIHPERKGSINLADWLKEALVWLANKTQ